MLEMMYTYFMEPRLDLDVFNNAKTSVLSSHESANTAASSQLKNIIDQRPFGKQSRPRSASKEMIEQTDKDKALAIF